MTPETPANIGLGINLGAVVVLLFLVANLAVILHLIQMVVAPKSKWTWLDNLRQRWHYVHYIGNTALLLVMILHAIFLGAFSSPLHWVLVALIVWMVFAGLRMRFTKPSPAFKRTFWRLHAKWYMFVVVLVIIILSHIWSLPNFPYPVG